MKILLKFTLFFILIGCCGEIEPQESELKGDVKMLTEYNISVKYDLLNNQVRDTVSVVRKYYNELNQIVKLNQNYIFSDETMDITYSYNSCKRLKKEQIKMSFESNTFDVDYIYKGSSLIKTISESARDSTIFKQIEVYHYNADKKLIKNSISQLYIDSNTGDTIKNSLQTDNYNAKGKITESKMEYRENPAQNVRINYFYEADDLIKTLEYNKKDSLISTYRFEYKKDKLGNYIEKKAFINDKLNMIKTCSIIYK